MKKKVLNFALCLLCYGSIGKTSAAGLVRGRVATDTLSKGHFLLKVSIKGIHADKFYINYLIDENADVKDSVIVENDSFIYYGKLSSPTMCYITAGNHRYRQQLFIEPTTIIIEGAVGPGNKVTTTGSKTNDEFLAYQEKTDTAFNRKFASMNAAFAKARAEQAKAKMDSITMVWDRLQNEQLASTIDYINQHPQSFLSSSLLNDLLSSDKITYAQGGVIYSRLSANVKAGIFGKRVAARLNTMKLTAMGSTLADFAVPDTAGKQIKLSNYKGRYLLITLWVANGPIADATYQNSLALYNQYHNKGLQMLSIAVFGSKKSWLSTISKYNSLWPQAFDDDQESQNLGKRWGIHNAPQTILVDPKGIVVARNLRGEMLDKKLSSVLK